MHSGMRIQAGDQERPLPVARAACGRRRGVFTNNQSEKLLSHHIRVAACIYRLQYRESATKNVATMAVLRRLSGVV